MALWSLSSCCQDSARNNSQLVTQPNIGYFLQNLAGCSRDHTLSGREDSRFLADPGVMVVSGCLLLCLGDPAPVTWPGLPALPAQTY